jgi:hypothetical protein
MGFAAEAQTLVGLGLDCREGSEPYQHRWGFRRFTSPAHAVLPTSRGGGVSSPVSVEEKRPRRRSPRARIPIMRMGAPAGWLRARKEQAGPVSGSLGTGAAAGLA